MPNLLDLLDAPDQTVIITASEEDLDRDKRFERACRMFPAAKIEMDAAGNLIMTPGNSEDSAFRSGEAFLQLALWAKKDGTGRAFDCSANFNLPNRAKRQPDAAWVPKSVLAVEGRAKLKTISKTRHVPVFLIEVTSPSDRLPKQIDKCVEWVSNGVKEAFLVHPKTKTVYVFRPDADMTTHLDPVAIVSSVLSGFVLDCRPLWEELV